MSFSETRRQTLHVSMVAFALLLRFLPIWGALICACIAFLHNLVVLPMTGREVFFRPEDKDRGYPLGILVYPVTVFFLILLYGHQMFLVGAAWAILSFGDGFATIVGKRMGRHPLPWCPEKSWEGSGAYVLFGTAGALLMALWIGSSAFNDIVTTTYPILPGSAAKLLWVCFAGALVAALIESLPTGIDDNISAPLVAGFLMYVLWGADPGRAQVVLEWGDHSLLVGLLVTGVVGIASYALGFVSKSGMLGGTIVGVLLVAGAGLRGFGVLLLFFVIGSAVSKFGYRKKQAFGAAQEAGGRRGSKHAAANCAAGVLLGLASLVHPAASSLFLIGFVAAFATAIADTTSSELGSLYGKSPILLTTFKSVAPGTEGAVSIEGTLIGIAFAALLAMSGWGLGLIPRESIIVVTAGGFIGMSFESYLGAATKGLDNELLNFLNTVVGATAAILLAAWLNL